MFFMNVAIHQPECFPWLGFFHKMSLADTFVLLDTVQFEKNNFQNRNKFLIAGEAQWLSIPVEKHSLNTLVQNIKINWTDEKLTKKHLMSIEQSYKKCEFFENVFPFLQELYHKKHEYLSNFNTEFIVWMAEALGIKTKIIKASEMNLSGTALGGTDVTLEICKNLGARCYISGAGAKVYLDVEKYKQEDINVYFQEFHHPVYPQKGSTKFVSHLSSIDLYVNCGEKSFDIIQSGNPCASDI
ncbi:MAG: hypothetical protein A3B90_00330 [Candidatus Magasanikbacteria bacterium RIFCSPHIGHO2_02_FULL_41_13]|uniref:WbqC-like protein n=1 Tax=Candidatus Magasanikbacteria bacterium RIFCSPHIGHO2_02_FULL_41_13 TaxID=1798676 RepID=A0A1F6M455_9BACT|nr:MAG: hypothetical protein A3B90_00330 [Candidatus Magasanikbacteria bacterium RIFCSPHIGHO2_02_FULL_41_13]